MTLRECYGELDGDCAGALEVLGSEERVRRYLLRFADDPTARMLFASLSDGRVQDAFRAAHTLKGLCRGLGLTQLFVSCSALTEALRGGKMDAALCALVRRDYDAAVNAIRTMEARR